VTAIEQFQANTDTLAEHTAEQVAQIYADLLAARIDQQTAILLIAAAINRSNAAAVSLGDAYMALQIEEQIQGVVTAVGIVPTDESERLVKAVQTILDESQPITPCEAVNVSETPTGDTHGSPEPTAAQDRLTRLARSEPLETAQQATHEAMQRQPLVEGWVRHFDADPCELCVWWWRDGKVWPKVHPFQTYKGCNCQPKVVLREHIKSTQFSRRLARNGG
jgi:hypothetical protein